MSYVQRVLQPGEQVRHVSSIHWIVLWPGVAVAAPSGGCLLVQRNAAPAESLAVYGIRARALCGRSSGQGMVPVVDHRDRSHQPARHLQERSDPAAEQRNEHGQGRERPGRPIGPRAHVRLWHREDSRHRRRLRGTAVTSRARSNCEIASSQVPDCKISPFLIRRLFPVDHHLSIRCRPTTELLPFSFKTAAAILELLPI